MYIFRQFIFIQKKVNKNHIIYWGDCKHIKNMLQKHLSKIPFYENFKMSAKGPFVVESFVMIGLLIMISFNQ
jgi:hypothetical protein